MRRSSDLPFYVPISQLQPCHSRQESVCQRTSPRLQASKCRQSQPLTLKQLANRTGKSVSLLSQIELGKSAASVSTLNDLSNALGVKMTYFFETV